MNEDFMKAAYLAFADSVADDTNPAFHDEATREIFRAFEEWKARNGVADSEFNELWKGPMFEYINKWLYAAFCSGYELGFGEGEEYERER